MRSRHLITPIALTALMAVPLVLCGRTAAGAAVTVPGAPRSVVAVQYGSGGAKVSWNAPASNGGSAITGYVVTRYRAGVALPPIAYNSPQTTRIITALWNGKSYRFTVAARNVVGQGPPSVQSAAIIVGAPGQPIILWVKEAVTHPGRVQVRVVRGIVNLGNGAPVLRLDATCTSSNGGATKSGRMQAPPPPSQRNMNPWVDVGKLTLGKTYTCVVTASNKYGTGIRSKPSVKFTV